MPRAIKQNKFRYILPRKLFIWAPFEVLRLTVNLVSLSNAVVTVLARSHFISHLAPSSVGKNGDY